MRRALAFASLALASSLFFACKDGLDKIILPDGGGDMSAVADMASPLGSPDGGGLIGSDCTSNTSVFGQGNCQPGLICLTEDDGYPGGLCVQECDADGTIACPDGTTCVGGELAYSCQPSCKSDKDCRTGYTCSQRTKTCRVANGGQGGPQLPAGTSPTGDACVMLPLPFPPPTFSTPVTATMPQHRATDPQIVYDRARKRLVAFWSDLSQTSDGLVFAESDDDGLTFSSPEPLPRDATNNKTDYVDLPSAVIDKDGRIALSWLGYSADSTGMTIVKMNVFVSVADAGSADFTTTVKQVTPDTEFVADGGVGGPFLAVSPVDGKLAATWTQLDPATMVRYIRLATSSDHGQTWSAPVTLSESDVRPKPVRGRARPAFGADGRLYVVWTEYDAQPFGLPTNAVFLQAVKADGTKDGGNVKVNGAGDSPAYDVAGIVVLGSNRVAVVFHSGDATGAWDIKMAVSEDAGKTWGTSFKLNDDATCATHFRPAVTVDADGVVHAIWFDNRYLTGNVFHTSVTLGAGTHTVAANEQVNLKSFTFTTATQGFAVMSDYIGLAASDTKLFASWTANAGQGFGTATFVSSKVLKAEETQDMSVEPPTDL